jgi:hypothetical protein
MVLGARPKLKPYNTEPKTKMTDGGAGGGDQTVDENKCITVTILELLKKEGMEDFFLLSILGSYKT